MEWAEIPLSLLWRNAWAVIPLAILVALICRTIPCRPATRHALWVLVLLWFVIPLGLPSLGPQRDAPGLATEADSTSLAAGVDTHPPMVAAEPEPQDTAITDALVPPLPLSADDPSGVPRGWSAAPGVESGDADAHSFDLSAISSALPRLFIGAGWPNGARDSARISSGASHSESISHPEPRVSTTLPPTARSGGMAVVDAKVAAPGPIRLRVPSEANVSSREFAELDARRRDLPDVHTIAVSDDVGLAPGTSDRPAAGDARLAQNVAPAAHSTEIDALADFRRLNPSNAGQSTLEPHLGAWWRGWLLGLVQIRDAFARLPALPTLAWLAGAGLVLGVAAIRIGCFGRGFAGARPAPREIQREVDWIARRTGLARPPVTFVTDARVSPMVWCVGRPRLILPLPLWTTLDRVGRRAILCHELAHIRRGDTRLRWLEIAISALFWWHPLVWWVRRRIQEEADLCCDAWVTWLLPRGRRAYAEALLQASRYTCDAGSSPAAAVGVTSAGAKGIARRLKMVMTETVRPRASWTGLALAGIVGLAGWTALPAWSAPGGEACAAAAQPTPTPCAPCPPSPAAAPAAPATPFVFSLPSGGARLELVPQMTTPVVEWVQFDPFATAVAQQQPSDELEARLARLERELAELSAALRARRGMPGQGGGTGWGPGQAPQPPLPPQAPRGRWAPQAPEPPRAGVLVDPGGGMTLTAPSISIQVPGDGDGPVEVRSYALPEGKLDALYELMVRNDVPIPVSKEDGSINIHATPAQHEVIHAFIRMIHPHGQADGAQRRGSPPADARGAFILGQPDAPVPDVARIVERARRGALAGVGQLTALRHQAEALSAAAQELRAQSEELRGQADRLRGESRASGRGGDLDAIERELRQLERAAERLEMKSQELREQANELRQRAETMSEALGDEDEDEDDDADDEDDPQARSDELSTALLALSGGVAALGTTADRTTNLAALLAAAGTAANTEYLSQLLSARAALAELSAEQQAEDCDGNDNSAGESQEDDPEERPEPEAPAAPRSPRP